MAIYSRLPAKPLFGISADVPADPPETKKIWQNRLLYLLETNLADKNLDNVVELAELRETYDLENLTLGDLLHLQQIIRAAKGDTKAYAAVDKVLSGVKDDRAALMDLADPFKKIVDIMHSAVTVARENTREQSPEDVEYDMFGDPIEKTIIEVDIDLTDNQVEDNESEIIK